MYNVHGWWINWIMDILSNAVSKRVSSSFHLLSFALLFKPHLVDPVQGGFLALPLASRVQHAGRG